MPLGTAYHVPNLTAFEYDPLARLVTGASLSALTLTPAAALAALAGVEDYAHRTRHAADPQPADRLVAVGVELDHRLTDTATGITFRFDLQRDVTGEGRLRSRMTYTTSAGLISIDARPGFVISWSGWVAWLAALREFYLRCQG